MKLLRTHLSFLPVLLLVAVLLLPASGVRAAQKTAAVEPPILTETEKRSLLSALMEADITDLRDAIDRRLISCHDLTAYYLERIEAYNKTYNCFITICDNALEEADKRDAALADGTASGTLFGIPIVVKDNIDYEGFHTTNGYKKAKNQIAADSAAIVRNLLNEGAVILAKSNMSTAAQEARRTSSSAVGETKNAYNTALASGGSSGGSAVSTSLNLTVCGLGTDTNSSLRYPAALNGCVSLRPTFGLLDRDGIVLLNTRRDTAGAITRSVLDQAILLDALTGGESHYAQELDGRALSGQRIGILKELSGPVSGSSTRNAAGIDKEVLAAFQNAVEELGSCGAEVVEVSLPKIFTMSSACSEDKSGYAKAKTTFYSAFETLLTENDLAAVIFPSYLHTPQYTGIEDGTLRIYTQTYIHNVSVLSPPTGLPEITVPIGFHSRGAGIGMEIASLKNNEQLLLDLAYSYTERFPHRVVPEGAPDLYADSHTDGLAGWISAYDRKTNETGPIPAVTLPAPAVSEQSTEAPLAPVSQTGTESDARFMDSSSR